MDVCPYKDVAFALCRKVDDHGDVYDEDDDDVVLAEDQNSSFDG